MLFSASSAMDFGNEQQCRPAGFVRKYPPPVFEDTSGLYHNEDRLASLCMFSEVGSEVRQDIDLSLDANWESYLPQLWTAPAEGLQNALPQANNEAFQSTWDARSTCDLMNMYDDQPLDLGQQHTFGETAIVQPPFANFQTQPLPLSYDFQDQVSTFSTATGQNNFMPYLDLDLETRTNHFPSINHQIVSHLPPLASPQSHIYPFSQTNPQYWSPLLFSTDLPVDNFPISFTNVQSQLPTRSQSSELCRSESYGVGILEADCNHPHFPDLSSGQKGFPNIPNLETVVFASEGRGTLNSAAKAKTAPHKNAKGLNQKRKGGTHEFSGFKRVRNTGYNESKGGYYTFSVKLDSKESHQESFSSKGREPHKARSTNVCIHCRIHKTKCGGSGISCDGCIAQNRSCIRVQDLIPITANYDVNIDLGPVIERIASPPTSVKTWSVQIFLDHVLRAHANIYEPSLECKISLEKTTLSEISSVSAKSFGNWELLCSQGRRSHCQDEAGKQLLNCSFLIDSMPSIEKLEQWALKSMLANPSGAIGKSNGQLFIFGTCYSRSRVRPLHDLVTLALTLTSIYNTCHSTLMLVFKKRPKATSHFCPPLRAQLYALLFNRFEEIGVELQEKLKRAIYESYGPAEEDLLPLFIIIWMLLLIYDHSLSQTNNAILWNTEREKSALEELEARRNRLGHQIRDVGKLYDDSFMRAKKPCSSIFKNDILEICNVSAEDTELLAALLQVQVALREPHLRALVPSAPLDKDLDKLLESMSMISLQPTNYEVAPIPVPLPSECTLSEKNRLDFDNMSSEKSSNGGERGSAMKAIRETSAKGERSQIPVWSSKCPIHVKDSDLIDDPDIFYERLCQTCKEKVLKVISAETRMCLDLGL